MRRLMLRSRQRCSDFPVELNELVQSVFENPFLIAMGAETSGSVFLVQDRSYAIALHALGAERRHVRRTSAHLGKRDRLIDLLIGGFDHVEGVGINARGRGNASGAAAPGSLLTRRMLP